MSIYHAIANPTFADVAPPPWIMLGGGLFCLVAGTAMVAGIVFLGLCIARRQKGPGAKKDDTTNKPG